MKVSCPICKKLVTYHGNEFRPFCSARCKTNDLGAWASGAYAVPLDKSENDETEDRKEKKSEEDDQE